MHDSPTKMTTAKSFYAHGVSDYDHDHFRARKHARNSSVDQEPGPLHHHHGNNHKSSCPLGHDHHGNDHDHKSDDSHESRIEAIAKGQKKLMEMASEMTESLIELSMTGLVETVELPSPENDQKVEEKCLLKHADVQRKVKVNRRKNGHIENGGLLLKINCPFSLGSKKKKNIHSPSSGSDHSNNSNGKDSPKNLLDDKEVWVVKSGESDFGESSKRSTSKSSSDSVHSHTNINRTHNQCGCWSFFCTGGRHGRGY